MNMITLTVFCVQCGQLTNNPSGGGFENLLNMGFLAGGTR
jgi:hypothetical protein